MRRPIALVATVALAVGAAGGTAALSTAKTSTATVKTRHTSLGTILVDAKGRTLYLFEKDTKNKSKCSGACATNWPPALTGGKPKGAGGVVAAKLGTTKRSDGTTQVTTPAHRRTRSTPAKNNPA